MVVRCEKMYLGQIVVKPAHCGVRQTDEYGFVNSYLAVADARPALRRIIRLAHLALAVAF